MFSINFKIKINEKGNFIFIFINKFKIVFIGYFFFLNVKMFYIEYI